MAFGTTLLPVTFLCLLLINKSTDAEGNSDAIGDPQFFEEVQLTPASQLFPETIDSPALSFQENTSSDVSQKRVDDSSDLGIDPSLLKAVLADPVLLEAVDPRVLQAVLVNAASSNLIPETFVNKKNKLAAGTMTEQDVEHSIKSLPVRTTPIPMRTTQMPTRTTQPTERASQLMRVPNKNEFIVETFPESQLQMLRQEEETKQQQFQQQLQEEQQRNIQLQLEIQQQEEILQEMRQQQQKHRQEQQLMQERQQQIELERLQLIELERQQQIESERQKQFEQERQQQLLIERQEQERQQQLLIERQEQERQQQLLIERQEQERQQQLLLERQEQDQQLAQQQQFLQDQGQIDRQSTTRRPEERDRESKQFDDLFLSRLDSLSNNLPDSLTQNPELARQLLGIPQIPPAGPGIFPPIPPPPPGVCSLVTATGIPCDPGLAFNPATGSCEWPDTLIEAGCNPEVVTGFGPCPQDAEDPSLTPAQALSWPNPKFAVNLDVVTIQNFDLESAKKYFIVCVPTIYGKLFPRLLCCPEYEYFDPLHVDGCVKKDHYDHPPPPVYHPAPVYEPPTYHEAPVYHEAPSYIPPPTYGEPDPLLHHIGTPLPSESPISTLDPIPFIPSPPAVLQFGK